MFTMNDTEIIHATGLKLTSLPFINADFSALPTREVDYGINPEKNNNYFNELSGAIVPAIH